MKKIITLMVLLTTITITTLAQISVEQSGRSVFGKYPPYNPIPDKLSASGILPKPDVGDTTATLQLFHRFDNDKAAYMNIGGNCWVGQYGADKGYMMLKATSGIKMMRNYFTYFEIHNNGCEFFKDVTAPAYLTSSDARLKSNINVLSNNSSKLQMITPYRYILDNSVKQELASTSSTEKLAENEPIAKPREQYGFLAQEVKEIFPNLVVEDENGWLSIDYIGFIPLLLDEVKRLQCEVESLEAAISEEKQQEIKKSKDYSAISIISEASLSQNRPNPFTGYTEISCVIPEGSADAYLCIYDLQGKQIQKYECEERGQVIISIDGTSLGAGMYIYALIIDGNEIDSKRMVVLQ